MNSSKPTHRLFWRRVVRALLTTATLTGLFAVFGVALGLSMELLIGPGGNMLVVGGIVGSLAGLACGVWQALTEGDEKLIDINTEVAARLRIFQTRFAAGAARYPNAIRTHRGRVRAIALSPDARSFVTAGDDGAVRLWDVRSGFCVRELMRWAGPACGVAISRKGGLIAACGQHGIATHPVVIWDMEAGREMRRFEASGPVRAVCFTPDGKRLLVGGANYLHVWDLESEELLSMISVKDDPATDEMICTLAASPDSKFVLCGCVNSGEARLINLQTSECVRRFGGHRSWLRRGVVGVAFAPDGDRVATASLDQTARVWDPDNGEQVMRFTGHAGVLGWHGVVAVAFRPGGRRVLSASEDGGLRLWSVEGGKEKSHFHHGAAVCCLSLARDGRVALTGGADGIVRVWELPD